MINYEEMLLYVKDVLTKSNAIKSKNPYHDFRDRFMHTKRVYEWTKVLHDELPVDENILYTAAIFHDIGYSKHKDEHAKVGAEIFKEYAIKNGFDKDFTLKVYDIIYHHSDKELIKDPNSSNELIILLEADLLDEEGALSIVWDLMALGHMKDKTYYDAIDALKHTKNILKQDYMVTPKAKKIWESKKELVKLFMNELEKDLFLEE
ncbi:MAG: HD domain-containing protein [Acholeplasmatales bacterium]|nr:HD domain-containing protein [Acholeplasmatales bacterium]